MSDLLELTTYSSDKGSPVYVNKNHIAALTPDGICTLIILSCGKEIKVSESLKCIKKLMDCIK